MEWGFLCLQAPGNVVQVNWEWPLYLILVKLCRIVRTIVFIRISHVTPCILSIFMFRCIQFHWWHIMVQFESTCKGGSSVTVSCTCFSFNVRHFIVQHFQPFVNIHHCCLICHFDINQMPPDVTCTYYILHLCCQNWPNTFSISEQSDVLFCLLVCKGFQVDFKYSWAFAKQGLVISVQVV